MTARTDDNHHTTAISGDPQRTVDCYGDVPLVIATDGHGVTRDEALEPLGSELKLPPWSAEAPELLEQRLPAVAVGVPAEAD